MYTYYQIVAAIGEQEIIIETDLEQSEAIYHIDKIHVLLAQKTSSNIVRHTNSQNLIFLINKDKVSAVYMIEYDEDEDDDGENLKSAPNVPEDSLSV